MRRHGVTIRRVLTPTALVLVLLMARWEAAGQAPSHPARNSARTQNTRYANNPQRDPRATPGSPNLVKVESGQSEEIQILKQLLAVQQQQIDQLRVALQEQRQLIEQALKPGEQAANATPTLGFVASVNPFVPASAKGGDGLALHAGLVTSGPPPQEGAPQDLEIVKGELEAMADSTNQTNQRVAKLEADVKDADKKNTARVKGLGNFNFSGDMRIRYENFIQDGNPTRNRERIRARLNITSQVADSLMAGISLATGTLDDPVSSNQTMTGFFNRKNFAVDRAFMTFKPKKVKPLTLDFGKFKYPWYRTPLTFDNDLNPEGFAQTLSFDLKGSGLKNISFVGFELPFNELSGGFKTGAAPPNAFDPTKPAYDSFLFGGQMQMKFKLSDKAKLGLYAAGLNFNRTNPIAQSLGISLNPSLANSNTLLLGGANGTTVLGYAYKFAYLDLIAQLDYQLTPKWPMTAFIDFVNNTRGPSGENRRGFWTEVMFGQNKEAKDIMFGYRYVNVGKDAVIGAFNESDLRSSTNVIDHVVVFGYQLHKNLTFQYTDWIGHLKDPLLNPALVPAGVRSNCTTTPFTNCRDPWLQRMQFDLIYKF